MKTQVVKRIDKPENIAISQRQNTINTKIDDKYYKTTKVTLECRNPVYKNLYSFLEHMFVLYDQGFKLSKERHSPWYYPFRITMIRDIEVPDRNKALEQLVDEIPSIVNKDGLTTKELLDLEKKKAKKKSKK